MNWNVHFSCKSAGAYIAIGTHHKFFKWLSVYWYNHPKHPKTSFIYGELLDA